VGIENLIVFDDGSVDGGTDGLACTVHRLPGFAPGRFETSRIRLVSGVAQGLLESYDAVIFTDVDEFLVPDPAKYDGLLDLLRSREDVAVLAPLALNVIHLLGQEAPLRDGTAVLDQRSYALFAPGMCKPSIKRVPAPWAAASHGIRAPYSIDPDLVMFHLKFADVDLLRAASARRGAVVALDGRGRKTTWAKGANELVGALEGVAARFEVQGSQEFEPGAIELSGLVVREGDVFRAPKRAPLMSLERQPVVRIPRRFQGAF
jgi:hypothetical protein